MTFISDIDDISKLTPEQKDQFSRLLDQFPELDTKQRELNTPFMQDMKAQGKPIIGGNNNVRQANQEQHKQNFLNNIENDDSILDYNDFERDYTEEPKVKSRVATAQIDPDNRMFKGSIDTEDELDEQREQARAQKATFIRKNNVIVDENNQRVLQEEKIPFSTQGKEHPILSKMRASLGLVSSEDIKSVDVGGVKYTMKRVTREILARVTGFVSFRAETAEEFTTNYETAILAWAVQEIDNVSKELVFNIPDKETDLEGKTRHLTTIQKHDKASEELYRFLNNSPNELIQALSAYYEQEFPSVNLLGPNRTFAICPEPNCTYKRILPRGEVGYCTYHGVELVSEADLPNPSRATR